MLSVGGLLLCSVSSRHGREDNAKRDFSWSKAETEIYGREAHRKRRKASFTKRNWGILKNCKLSLDPSYWRSSSASALCSRHDETSGVFLVVFQQQSACWKFYSTGKEIHRSVACAKYWKLNVAEICRRHGMPETKQKECNTTMMRRRSAYSSPRPPMVVSSTDSFRSRLLSPA